MHKYVSITYKSNSIDIFWLTVCTRNFQFPGENGIVRVPGLHETLRSVPIWVFKLRHELNGYENRLSGRSTRPGKLCISTTKSEHALHDSFLRKSLILAMALGEEREKSIIIQYKPPDNVAQKNGLYVMMQT